jgi:G:T/U-mismatch repair DNA glycosylase
MPNKEVKSIFLGSFPIWEIVRGPIDGNNLEFFYGSIVNDFWNCLGGISNIDVNNLNNRMSILDNFKIGITDILKIINRNPESCNSDSCLTCIEYNDILDLKKHFPKLENIFMTLGGKGPIGNLNNKSVATWFKNSLQGNQLQGFNLNNFVKNISIGSKKLNLIYLYSPSPQANVSIQGVLNKNNNFDIQNITIQQFRRLQWCYFLRKYHFAEANNIETIEDIWNQVNNNQELVNFFEN